MMNQHWLAGALLLTLALGCSPSADEGGDSRSNAGTASNGETTSNGETAGDPVAAGILEGRVLFEGDVPPPRKIVVNKDVDHCGKLPAEQQDVVVSSSGGLANVVVEVLAVDAPDEGWTWEHPKDGYALRQKGCAFRPAVVILPAGQELKVFNDDPVSHNINTGEWNFMQSGGDTEPLVRSVSGRQPVRVQCNIHSWMESWIYTVASPLYAVTDEDGNFRVEGVPPGKYRVRAWHPSLRREQESIEFSEDQGVRHEFVFQSPG